MKILDVLQLVTFFAGSILFGIGVGNNSILMMVVGIASMILSILNEIAIIKTSKSYNKLNVRN